MGTTSDTLILSLTTAMRRLESGHQQHDRRIQTHEQVTDDQQTQSETAIRTHQVKSRQANSKMGKNEEHLRVTQNSAGELMIQYEQAPRMWEQTNNGRGAETIRLPQQMHMAPNPPRAAKNPPINPPVHMRCPPPPPRPPMPPTPGSTIQESPCLPVAQFPFPDKASSATHWESYPSTVANMSGVPTTSPAPSGCPTNSLPGPSPSVVLAPPLIGNFPCFAPSTYRRWGRGIRLRAAGFPMATASKFISKIIDTLHPATEITGMSYMGSTDAAPHLRTVEAAALLLLDGRYAKTDTDRAWGRTGEFTTFTLKPEANMEDSLARFLRVTPRLEAHPMKMCEEMVCHMQYRRWKCRMGNFQLCFRRSRPTPTVKASTAR